MNLKNPNKFVIAFAFITISIIGFMVKLPPVFRSIDQEMHALFYFSAAFFFNYFFGNKKISTHIFIFCALFTASCFVEFAQEYSNRIFGKIHGNFDPQDVKYNLLGLVAFSVVWVVMTIPHFVQQISNRAKGIHEDTAIVKKLEHLKKLLDATIISQEEFDEKKKELINRI